MVSKMEKESEMVTSSYLQHVNGETVPDFKAGQFLSFRFPKTELGTEHDIVRNYSLSCCPAKDYLKISVKRDVGNIDLGHPEGLVFQPLP